MLDVLGDNPEAVEADLIHHYPGYGRGGPLAAFWKGEITLRLLRVMVEQLPPNSATARAENGHDWQHADYATQDTVDLLALLVTQFANAHRDPKKYPNPMPLPEPGWRPGDPPPEDTAAAEEERRAKARDAYERLNSQLIPGKG
ncbi:hypothetical protein DMA15_12710 [Streptomyces sp. WAC 01529]|uniref:hypothetical protein n=1 Tax=Streptomyces sp. WAC 01529 TaxID=2203205 RepID=UPI000F6D47DD|nr:hypothetical protein [Streptomyces sp. WAC 01529]AZM53339.1 hypothetical protein DMA15_12710 [Streptomyces sp. WAC 01529]